MKVVAKLVTRPDLDTIDVIRKDDSDREIMNINMYDGSINRYTGKFSANEIKKIWLDCENQLINTPKDDIPQTFLTMMKELKQVMLERKIAIKREVDPLVSLLCFFKPITRLLV